VYVPNYAFSGEMQTIVNTLETNFNAGLTSEMRTDHLCSRIIPAQSCN
jgi:hypothetical protein